MVYNAMKLFMEVNPQLFDECSHEYAEKQQNAQSEEQARKQRWDKLAELAAARKTGSVDAKAPLPSTGSKVGSPMRTDDQDPLSQDSQRRLEALRLQDDAMSNRERRPKDYAVR